MARITNQQAESKIAEHEAFETRGGLWATELSGSSWSITTGKLPVDVAEELNADIRSKRVSYVVYSYRTPIAWVVKRAFDRPECEVPQIYYSDTTRRHQNLVRRVWDVKEG